MRMLRRANLGHRWKIPEVAAVASIAVLLVVTVYDVISPLDDNLAGFFRFIAVAAQFNLLGWRIERALRSAFGDAVRNVVAGSKIEKALTATGETAPDSQDNPGKAGEVLQLPVPRQSR